MNIARAFGDGMAKTENFDRALKTLTNARYTITI